MANAEHVEILKSGVEVWNKWREENEDIRPDLSGANLMRTNLAFANLAFANLSGADLIGANLTDANLTFANLMGANLAFTNLSRADLNNADFAGAELLLAKLIGANLAWAHLREANLSRADLNNADLSGADLFGAYLILANLYKTNLTRAKFGNTVLGLTDLNTCIGFNSIEVSHPCSIDFQTLRASKNLPKSFLLKIGLPELYIDYLPDFYQDEGLRLYPVFLSHSWENKAFARKLYEALIAKGVSVFFDEKKMKPGDDIYKSISKGIEHYDKMILVCSKDSLNSWWVDRELDRVLKKERSLQKEEGRHIDLLIPITIDDTVFQWDGPKSEEVQRYVIGDFKNWQDDAAFEMALNKLIDALNVDRPEIKPPTFLRKDKGGEGRE